MRLRVKSVRAALFAAIAIGGGAAPAAAAPDPLYVFTPTEVPVSGGPPIDIELDGPCGLAVDANSHLYASSYYREAVVAFDVDDPTPTLPQFVAQIVGVDAPLGGPCGLAVGPAPDGALYVNSFHRNVEEFIPSAFPLPETPSVPPSVTYSSEGHLDSALPTGVAVDPASGHVYVNHRTHVAVYDAAGDPVMDGAEPLEIGEGTLGDGYGLAVSAFPATAGHVYVADAVDGTVKAYDPAAADEDLPAQVIDGAAIPDAGGFTSLRESALAVDRVRGRAFVVDNLQPAHTERPQAAVRVFGSGGGYLGRLKHSVVHGGPSGLAVDNSTEPTQGRVYVTSGNETRGSIYAYDPDSEVPDSQAEPPLEFPALPPPLAPLAAGPESAAAGAAPLAAAWPPVAAASEVAQKGNLRVSVSGKLSPRRLPRGGLAPIAVTVGGRITTTDASLPPRLRRLRIELNRHGKLDSTGLPTCVHRRIQPGSSSRALSGCRSALVGRGTFTADITLAGQEPYPTKGRLLVFNGRAGCSRPSGRVRSSSSRTQEGRQGERTPVRDPRAADRGRRDAPCRTRPVLFGHLYSPKPFATSFVIVFRVQRLRKGTYGTMLNAPLPKAMDAWGRLTGLRMTLSRRYSHRGRRHSFISAGCPAPRGFPGADFPLARTGFSFDGGRRISSTLTRSCRVR